ncbi:hypothetical protein [Yersinia nurmii]|uniref:hypothetical protein n=1 Tax=Yersinia nurmii TaxID=685706 RepID=UPI00069DCFC1|nr:hypothetical protein [Yersinia nurmii]
MALAGEIVGSSARGEQPKFTCCAGYSAVVSRVFRNQGKQTFLDVERSTRAYGHGIAGGGKRGIYRYANVQLLKSMQRASGERVD